MILSSRDYPVLFRYTLNIIPGILVKEREREKVHRGEGNVKREI
jgi:hypothetical protein